MDNKPTRESGDTRRSRLDRLAVCLGLAFILLISPACQGSGPAEPAIQGDNATPDAAVMEMLQTELARILGDDPVSHSASDLVSYPGEPVENAMLFEYGDGTRALTWSYSIPGDYDLNGVVNVSDLTPLGIHFGKTVGDADWETAKVADGDGNGVISVSDITPIGVNFYSAISGFEIHAAELETGLWDLAFEVPYSEGIPMEAVYQFAPLIDDPALADFLVIPLLTADDGNRPYVPGVIESVSGTIGPAGGELELPSGARLIIPPGACSAATDISLEQIDGIDEVAIASSILTFNVKASSEPSDYELSYPHLPGMDAETGGVAIYDPDDPDSLYEMFLVPPGSLDSMQYNSETGEVRISVRRVTASQSRRVSSLTWRQINMLLPAELYHEMHTEEILEVPYYSQEENGGCGPACMAMMMKAVGTDMEVYEICKGIGFDDNVVNTWYLSGISLPRIKLYMDKATEKSTKVNISLSKAEFLGNILYQIDSGHPVMILEPLHAELVVGYKVTQDNGTKSYTLITHDPNDNWNPGGGRMYTERRYDDIINLWKSYAPPKDDWLEWIYEKHLPKIYSYPFVVINSPIVTTEEQLLSLGVPYTEHGDGYIEFEGNHPVSGKAGFEYKLFWRPSSSTGYVWGFATMNFGVKPHSPLANSIKKLKMKLPVWNADDIPHDIKLFWQMPEKNSSTNQAYLFGNTTLQLEPRSRSFATLEIEDYQPEENEFGGVDRLVMEYWLDDYRHSKGEPFDLWCYLSTGAVAVDMFEINVDIKDAPHISIVSPGIIKPETKLFITGSGFGIEPADTSKRSVKLFTYINPIEYEASIVSWQDNAITCIVPADLNQMSERVDCDIQIVNEKATSDYYKIQIDALPED